MVSLLHMGYAEVSKNAAPERRLQEDPKHFLTPQTRIIGAVGFSKQLGLLPFNLPLRGDFGAYTAPNDCSMFKDPSNFKMGNTQTVGSHTHTHAIGCSWMLLLFFCTKGPSFSHASNKYTVWETPGNLLDNTGIGLVYGLFSEPCKASRRLEQGWFRGVSICLIQSCRWLPTPNESNLNVVSILVIGFFEHKGCRQFMRGL